MGDDKCAVHGIEDDLLPIADVTEHVTDNVQCMVSMDTCSKIENFGALSILISQNNKLPIAEVTEHAMDDAQSKVSMYTCSKAETPRASSTLFAEELSIENDKGEEDGHGPFSIHEKVLWGHGMGGSTVRASCPMEGNKPPCQKDAIVEPRHVQNAAAANTSSKAETLVAPFVIDADNLSIENNECEKYDHQREDLFADIKALQGHGMDTTMVICEVIEDDKSSLITSTVEDDLQEHGIKRKNHVPCGARGDDELNNFASENICTDAGTLFEQSGLTLNGKKNDGEETDHQHSCFVSPSGNEEHKHFPDGLPSCEIIPDQENISINHVEGELYGNIGNSLSNDELVDTHDPVFEMGRSGEDEGTKLGAKNPLTDVIVEALDKAEVAHVYQFSDATNHQDNFSNAESCEEENSRFGNEDFEIGDVCSSAVLKSEALQHDDAKHELSAVCENVNSFQESADSSGVGNALLSHYSDFISGSLLNTEYQEMSIAHIGEGGNNLVSRQDICEDIPEVGSMKLQDMSGDGTTNGSLEVLTCVLDAVDISNFAHRESAGDEDCPWAAGQAPCMKNLSPSSSIAQVRDIDASTLHVQHIENNKSLVKVFGVCQTGGTPSNESQLDKDGGSSVESTAGTGWKLQGTDAYIAAEDEEASSTGGDDSASSPACPQPLTQQRKKINIHHQFVREIVKIQHDRELYDREQAERQIQAQQAATSVQLGVKSLDSKGQKINLSDPKQLRSAGNKISSQGGLKDRGDDSRQLDPQQKHAARNKKSLVVQAKSGSSHQKIAPQESSERIRPPALQGRDSFRAKDHGLTGQGRQQRSMSIYRPPVVRDSLAAEELEISYHQSGACAMNSSPGSFTSSVSDPHVPFVVSPNLRDDEGTLQVARSSSGETFTNIREPQAEQCTPGMGIKVTFDTEKKQRHIEVSDFLRGHWQNEEVASHSSSSGFRTTKSPIINPPLSHPPQESKSSYSDRRPAAGSYFAQADRNSSLQGSSSEFSQGKTGKVSHKNIDRKNSFLKQVDNSAVSQHSSAWSHNSLSLSHHDNNGVYTDSARHAEGHGPNIYGDHVRHAVDTRRPSASLQVNTPSSRKSSSSRPSYKGELSATTSYSSPSMRGNEPNQTSRNSQARFQPQQLTISRSKQDLKGKQWLAVSSDVSNKKRDSQQSRNSIKEPASPFHAMMKDSNRQHAVFASSIQSSTSDARLDVRGFGTGWDIEDHVHSHNNQDSLCEDLKRTHSDVLRKGSTQNLQAQSSPLPLKESFFLTMPMQEKWGDIVDDQYDSYDYLHEEERESRAASALYGGNVPNRAPVDVASLKPENQMHTESKQNKVLRNSRHSETGNMQRNKAASDLRQEQLAYETPVRKSVFERLGPQNNFKESILGPPPKVMDSRGVLRASPDAIISNTSAMSTFRNFDTGFHGSQKAPPPHLSSMLLDPGDNLIAEGREVVVQAYTELKPRRSKRELYVPRRGS